MEFLKKTNYWCYCGDAQVVNNKIQYTKFQGSRGYPEGKFSHEEILEKEKNQTASAVLYVKLTINPDEEVPKEYHVLSSSKITTDQILPEFIQQKLEIYERNRIKVEKLTQEKAKITEILNETSEKMSFLVDLTGDQIYGKLLKDGRLPIKLDRQKEFEDEMIPFSFYRQIVRLGLLFAWNSPEAEFIRENFKQETFLKDF